MQIKQSPEATGAFIAHYLENQEENQKKCCIYQSPVNGNRTTPVMTQCQQRPKVHQMKLFIWKERTHLSGLGLRRKQHTDAFRTPLELLQQRAHCLSLEQRNHHKVH